MNLRPSFLLVASVIAAFAACSSASSRGKGTGTGNPPPSEGGSAVQVAKSSKSQDTSPAVPLTDQTALETGNRDFAFQMYASLRAGSPTTNLFFSPFSISSAMAMTYAGAGGTTASEIASGMSFTLPPAQLHPAFDWLDLAIASRAPSDAPDGGGTPLAIHLANSLWGDKSVTFQQPFLDTLAIDYGAGVEQVDFTGNPAAAFDEVNQWVSTQTQGDVPQVLPPNAIDGTTLFVIVNAIYMKASWQWPFDAQSTADRPFTPPSGTAEKVPAMEQPGDFAYAESAGAWQIVELPYVGGKVAMDIVLPAPGTDAQFEAGLSAAEFSSMVGAMKTTFVDLVLPKFKIAGPSFSIADQLKALGIKTAFTASADFSPMVGSTAVDITHVFQQSFVSVDEKGTEAAAATAVVGGDAGIEQNPASMTVDHPFFIAIRDIPTGTILFAGKIEDPAH
ncbi:MAG TPA: serpin family protein [Polyangiaceae bacterium]